MRIIESNDSGVAGGVLSAVGHYDLHVQYIQSLQPGVALELTVR